MIEYEKDYFETKLDNGNTLAIEDFLDGAIDIFEIPFEYRTEEMYERLRGYFSSVKGTEDDFVEVNRALFERQMLNDIVKCAQSKEDFKATDEKMQELKKGLKSNHEALEKFLGVKLSSLNPAEIEEQMEETISQMPEEELEKFYDKYAFSVERNISHILTVSTGHISKKTRDLLTRAAHGETYFPVAVYEKGKCGFYLYVPDEMDDTLPVELKHLLQITKSLGCEILCLDSDGSVLPNMEHYNW